MGATRFPGKPMKKICGMPMIEHVYRRAQLINGVTSTYVATCDKEIFEFIKSIGGNVVMTSSLHDRATDRTAEAAEIIEKLINKRIDVIVMIQGDEPLLEPSMFDQMLPYFLDEKIKVVNFMSKLKTYEEFIDSNEVKVVVDSNNNALYFSREPIPSLTKWSGDSIKFKQLGIISFTKDYLLKFYKTPQTPLEKIESVDMLRVLENGHSIKMLEVDTLTIGVDTPAELLRVEKIMQDDNLFLKYKK
jgi:3-deoxy-manno-octulosonate cytidylyltransferase (CMP-KDO synthetase)